MEKSYIALCNEQRWNPSLEEACEYCPHCESEVLVPFDPTEPEFKQKCPKCNKRLMICSECINVYGCDFEWNEDKTSGYCRHNKSGD